MLERISIKGYKSFRELDFSLRPLNVLIGANGSGKSNFLSVFRLMNQIIEKRLSSYVARVGGANKLLHFGQNVTGEVSIRLDFGDYGYAVRLIPTFDDKFFFDEETYWHKNQKVALGDGHFQSLLPDKVNGGDK